MKTNTILFSLPLFLLCGCDRKADTQAAGKTHAADKTHAPDNTASNSRDRSGDTLTPTDQAGNAVDLALTQKVRQALMDDEALSTNAQNVKVITVNGKVTLRGVVDSQAEKDSIAAKVKTLAGVGECDNQLEVKPN